MVKRKAKTSESENFEKVRSLLLNRLQPNSRAQGMDTQTFTDQKKHLFMLMKSTVLEGESNSALLIGPRGSGKSLVMNEALNDLKQTVELENLALVVKLNGFFQTDDKIAIEEITRQLSLENVVAGKVFGSFAENLGFLLASLKTRTDTSKSIIFILEEFDLFCQHKNQTLLYNLFDICQSNQAPVTVIGITCRMDVIELLEKRVKSRFSHRQIYLLARPDFEKYCKFVENILTINDSSFDPAFIAKWNNDTNIFLKNPDVINILQKLHDVNPKPRAISNILALVVSRIDELNNKLGVSDFIQAYEAQTEDSKIQQLRSLSVLELLLVFSMKYLDKLYDGQPCNFETVFFEYERFTQQQSATQKFDRSTAMKAFEHLGTLELIRPADGISTTKTKKEYIPYHLLATSSQISAAIKKINFLPTEIRQWANTCIN